MEAALDAWASDDEVALVIIDGAGEKAFCAGGDIAEMYRRGRAGDYDYGRGFWADEYRLNAKIFEFPKPYVAFMQGFTMGGGVGVACHGSHRIVGETSRISMPECAIGLIPDVGGSLLLARAPGRVGEYLAVTGHRMNGPDAVFAGFADYVIAEAQWHALIAELEASGDVTAIDHVAGAPQHAPLSDQQAWIDAAFRGVTLADVMRGIAGDNTEIAGATRATIAKASPLAAACAYDVVARVRATDDIRHALDVEYRYTYRSKQDGDFLEGIRAAIIDKDRNPVWKHDSITAVPQTEVSNMLMPLGENRLTFEKETGA